MVFFKFRTPDPILEYQKVIGAGSKTQNVVNLQQKYNLNSIQPLRYKLKTQTNNHIRKYKQKKGTLFYH